jgi:hypothetical protein
MKGQDRRVIALLTDLIDQHSMPMEIDDDRLKLDPAMAVSHQAATSVILCDVNLLVDQRP